jgi:hypothetical protein
METQRENFTIQHEIVMTELQKLLEKTKTIEAQLLRCCSPQVMPHEFYRPSVESQDMQPPKKKMRFTK